MACVECGRKSRYRLCSNACARANQGAKRALCAVCYVDPKTGCRGTNQTTQLCDSCRRDPVNTGWSEAWQRVESVADIDKAARKARGTGHDEPQTLATIDGVPIKPATERERQILILLAHENLTTREVAARIGCSQTFVVKVVKRYWPHRTGEIVGSDRGAERNWDSAAFEHLISLIGRGEQQPVFECAFAEYRITRQFSTGNGDDYVAVWRVPRWFWWAELGYGDGEGPSLEETLRTLRATNALRRKLHKAAKRGRSKRGKKSQLSRELRAVIEDAGFATAN
jgi:transposase